jgi:hypothetical protein
MTMPHSRPTGSNMLKQAEIHDRLVDPRTPTGDKITWLHPLLIFFAENGSIPASEEAIKNRPIINCSRSVSKSTAVLVEWFAYRTEFVIPAH